MSAGTGVVVVGNGMAGSRFVTELRARDTATPVTVIRASPSRARAIPKSVTTTRPETPSIRMLSGLMSR